MPEISLFYKILSKNTPTSSPLRDKWCDELPEPYPGRNQERYPASCHSFRLNALLFLLAKRTNTSN